MTMFAISSVSRFCAEALRDHLGVRSLRGARWEPTSRGVRILTRDGGLYFVHAQSEDPSDNGRVERLNATDNERDAMFSVVP